MKRFRDPSWTFIILFLGILALIPLIQTVQEATGEGEGIMAFQVFNQFPSAENLRSYEDNMESASWAAKLSRPWYQFAHFKWLKEGGEKVVVGSSGWYFYKPGLNYMLARKEIVEPSSATKDPVAAIVHFRDQLATHGIHLIVMPVPNKESIYPDNLSSRAARGSTILTPRTKEIMEKLRTHEVEIIDLFQEFRENRQRDNRSADVPLYLAQDTHWSPAGVSLAAKVAARRLTELRWIQRGNVDYQERPTPVQRQGDLVRMLQSPLIERSTPKENVPTVQIVEQDSHQLYADQPDTDLLVIGDSFMRIYQTDEPASAGFIAHLARELKKPLLSFVNDGGGSTLVREELAARPIFLKGKKVVLWEFVERDFGVGLKGWQRVFLPPPEGTNSPPAQASTRNQVSRSEGASIPASE